MQTYDEELLTRAIEAAEVARARGNHPFGASLATASGEVLIASNMVNEAKDPTAHAEILLLRKAGPVLSREEFRSATVYASTEPCAMCCGAIYTAGVRRVVFGVAKSLVFPMVDGDPANPMLRMESRTVFDSGPEPVEVVGPWREGEVARRALAVHAGFWAPRS